MKKKNINFGKENLLNLLLANLAFLSLSLKLDNPYYRNTAEVPVIFTRACSLIKIFTYLPNFQQNLI
jgi:hypothetical protein